MSEPTPTQKALVQEFNEWLDKIPYRGAAEDVLFKDWMWEKLQELQPLRTQLEEAQRKLELLNEFYAADKQQIDPDTLIRCKQCGKVATSTLKEMCLLCFNIQRAEASERREKVLREALEAILREPFGCPFCDSGKLRHLTYPSLQAKGHDETCGFALAAAALSQTKPAAEPNAEERNGN